MADETTPPAEAKPAKSSKPFFGTPMSLLGGAIVLWLGSAASIAMANYALFQLPGEGPERVVQNVVIALFVVLAVILAFFAIAMLIVGSVRWAMFGRTFEGNPVSHNNDQTIQLLRQINARLLLSDTAKRIAYRQEDVNALRRAIRDDMAKGDFDAAMVLVQEMSHTFGYREEAEQFREQINAARAKDLERKVTAAIKHLDEIIARHDFEAAAREAQKLQRLYPESEQVKVAVRRVVQAREQYKHQVEREFLAAAERDDVDAAIELLKELDKYLTEEEAEPFRETARGVIGKKRDNLGVQFKIAVHDKEWTRAVHVGEQIIREFPNTRMADEVRSMLDLLRERAAGQQAVAMR
jgi:outer membrane protein assembly factor BamD (BamD/ComL family)